QDQVSDGCKQAVAKATGQQNGGAPPANSTPATTPPPAPSPTTPLPAAPATTAPSKKPAAATPKSASAQSSSGTKEKFAERVITDPDHQNMRAVTLLVPEKWHFDSKMEWHYNWTEHPLSYSSHAENPDNGEAYFQYPLLPLEYIEVAPQYR